VSLCVFVHREFAGHVPQLDRSCGRLGPARLGRTSSGEPDDLRIVNLPAAVTPNRPARGSRPPRRLRFPRRCGRCPEVRWSFFIDREEKIMVAPYSGAMLPVVARSGRGQAACLQRIRQTCRPPFTAQGFRHAQHQVAVTPSRSFRSAPCPPSGMGSTPAVEHGGFGLDAATPQPTTPMPLMWWCGCRCRLQRVRGNKRRRRRHRSGARRARYSRLTPGGRCKAGGTTPKVSSLHAPFHELVALAVALNSSFMFRSMESLWCRSNRCDRMVHHQIDRHQRLDGFSVPCPA
jgi:hypothetical protein